MLKNLIKKAEHAIPKLTQKIECVSGKLNETRDAIAKLRLEIDSQLWQKREVSEKEIRKRADLQCIRTRYGRRAAKLNLDLQRLRSERQKAKGHLAKMDLATQIHTDREAVLMKRLRAYTELIEKADAAERYLERAERTVANSFQKTDEFQKLDEGVVLLESLYQQIADKRIPTDAGRHPEPQVAQQRPNRRTKRLLRGTKARIGRLKEQIANESQRLDTMRRERVSIENDHRQTQGIIRFLNAERQLSKDERQLENCRVANRIHRDIVSMDDEVKRRRDEVTSRQRKLEDSRNILARVSCKCGPARDLALIEAEALAWKSPIRQPSESRLIAWLERLEYEFVS
jgi:hypothetical protein